MISLLNLARGRDWIAKGLFPPLAAIAVAFYLQNPWALLICIPGFYLWSIFGWEFSAIHGRPDPHKYHGWIRWLTRDIGSPKLRGVAMMGLRGMYLYPMFIGLACLLGPEWLLIGLLCALQGVIYWLVGLFGERKYSVASSEFLFGLMLDATFITTWGMDVC